MAGDGHGVAERPTGTELREIDRQVAERIMGLKYAGVYVAEGPLMESPSDPLTSRVCPYYSSDIRAAFQLVDEMHARVLAYGCESGSMPPWPDANYLTLSCLGSVGKRSGWAAAFTCVEDFDELPWHENVDRFNGAIGKTPAEAISRAALQAVGVTP
jgi:hypothetical protein